MRVTTWVYLGTLPRGYGIACQDPRQKNVQVGNDQEKVQSE